MAVYILANKCWRRLQSCLLCLLLTNRSIDSMDFHAKMTFERFEQLYLFELVLVDGYFIDQVSMKLIVICLADTSIRNKYVFDINLT
jgi:predicted permease